MGLEQIARDDMRSLREEMPKRRNHLKGASGSSDGFSNLVDEGRRSIAQES